MFGHSRLVAPAAILLLAATLAGCASTPTAQKPGATPTGLVRTPTPGPTVTVVRSAHVLKAGASGVVRAQAGVSLRLTTTRPSVSRHRLSSSYGYAPAHGYYVTFGVTIANTGTSPVDIGPADFFVRVPHQGRVTTVMGNAPYSGASAQLNATQVDAGQRLGGPLTFDVRSPHGTLSFAPDGAPALIWSY